MNGQEKAVARLMFQTQVSRLTGIAFQNFFSRIMSYAQPGFAPVKPQGSQGDWKNDGHAPSAGRYYQVYSPETFDESSAIRKLRDDFSGLLDKWNDGSVYPNGVTEFYFVINDAYRITPGTYPTTLAVLEELKNRHGLKECKPFLTKDLEDILFNLTEDQIIAVIGFTPNPADIRVLSFNLVNEVIKHIIENPVERSLNQTLVSPDYDEKISFNRLRITGHWLRDASYRSGSLEEYFHASSNFTRQEVRDRLKAIYEKSTALGYTNDQNGATSADKQLVYILNEIAPTHADADRRLKKEIQDAALVVMSLFFESCDIFEEPEKC